MKSAMARRILIPFARLMPIAFIDERLLCVCRSESELIRLLYTHIKLVEFHIVAPAVFGVIHGGIGVLDKLLPIAAVFGVKGDSNT